MKYYIPAIICSVLIFWLSVTSGVNFPQTFKDLFSFDKVAHAIAYGVQAGLLFWAVYKSRGNLSAKSMFLISVGVALYGISMEIIQYCFFPSRYFEELDILANIMGIVIVHMIFKQLLNKTTAA